MLIGCISDNIIREFYLFGSSSHTRCRSCKQKKRTRSFRNERKTKKKLLFLRDDVDDEENEVEYSTKMNDHDNSGDGGGKQNI